VLDLVEAGLPVEDDDDALDHVLPWVTGTVAPLSADPPAALDRVHRVALGRAGTAAPGSTLQLAAFQSAIRSAGSAETLQGWLDGAGLPAGLEVDLDLRWLILVRLAVLGGVDRDGLDRHLAREDTAKSRVEHARAVASLPDGESKAWAWRRFTGEVRASNYEIEACGLGMWRPGQEHLTAPYVDRYLVELPGLADVHHGWVLGDVTESFFPITSLSAGTAERAEVLAATDGLDGAIRRHLVDRADELRRRIAVRARYAA
jgi:aminopeptidase N